MNHKTTMTEFEQAKLRDRFKQLNQVIQNWKEYQEDAHEKTEEKIGCMHAQCKGSGICLLNE